MAPGNPSLLRPRAHRERDLAFMIRGWTGNPEQTLDKLNNVFIPLRTIVPLFSTYAPLEVVCTLEIA